MPQPALADRASGGPGLAPHAGLGVAPHLTPTGKEAVVHSHDHPRGTAHPQCLEVPWTSSPSPAWERRPCRCAAAVLEDEEFSKGSVTTGFPRRPSRGEGGTEDSTRCPG